MLALNLQYLRPHFNLIHLVSHSNLTFVITLF